MEYKIKKTYEIIEYSPTVLKTNIPLFDFFTYGTFYLGTPIYFFLRTLKTNESFFNLFKNKDKFAFDGAEEKFSTLKDLSGNTCKFIPDNILKTEIIFHKNKKAFSLLKDLINKGYNININLISNHFLIKEKFEYYNINSENSTKEEVLFSSPEFAEKIAYFFKINQK